MEEIWIVFIRINEKVIIHRIVVLIRELTLNLRLNDKYIFQVNLHFPFFNIKKIALLTLVNWIQSFPGDWCKFSAISPQQQEKFGLNLDKKWVKYSTVFISNNLKINLTSILLQS